jgi:hypothetical protein
LKSESVDSQFLVLTTKQKQVAVMEPTRYKFTILKQVMEPSYLVSKLSREHGVEERSRSFTPWSHVVSLVYAQLSHALGLNDAVEPLRREAGNFLYEYPTRFQR